ncbi:Os12g0536000, partial [Oryza sativa Japonica Group]
PAAEAVERRGEGRGGKQSASGDGGEEEQGGVRAGGRDRGREHPVAPGADAAGGGGGAGAGRGGGGRGGGGSWTPSSRGSPAGATRRTSPSSGTTPACTTAAAARSSPWAPASPWPPATSPSSQTLLRWMKARGSLSAEGRIDTLRRKARYSVLHWMG